MFLVLKNVFWEKVYVDNVMQYFNKVKEINGVYWRFMKFKIKNFLMFYIIF